jgi:protease I
MAEALSGKKIAILATDGVEQSELQQPLAALRQAGAEVDIVAPHGGEIQGMQHEEKGERIKVGRTLDAARAEDYSALVLPGGVANPDKLRTEPAAIAFVRHFVTARKPIAAICHGPWTLIEAGGAKGVEMTSWPSLKTDLSNAGARWVDREVVVDRGLVSSRKPGDLPAFCKKMVEEFAEGVHRQRPAAE